MKQKLHSWNVSRQIWEIYNLESKRITLVVKVVVDLSSIQGETVDVMVYDMTGKLISTKNNEENALITFDMDGLSKGVYQIQLISEKAQTVRRVVKL